MTTQNMVEAIKLNAHKIAVDIKASQEIQKSHESKFAKECAKAVAYDHIVDMIYGGDEE